MTERLLTGILDPSTLSYKQMIILCLFLQYCEYYPNYDKCKKWLEANLPDEFEKLVSLKGRTILFKQISLFCSLDYECLMRNSLSDIDWQKIYYYFMSLL